MTPATDIHNNRHYITHNCT